MTTTITIDGKEFTINGVSIDKLTEDKGDSNGNGVSSFIRTTVDAFAKQGQGVRIVDLEKMIQAKFPKLAKNQIRVRINNFATEKRGYRKGYDGDRVTVYKVPASK